MKKIVRQCTALVLALVLLFCDCTASFGAEISSEEVPAFTGETLEETPMPAEETDAGTEEFMEEAEAPRVLFEMEELRETSAKQFRLSDGTILAAQYGMDVHYENEEGTYEEIDNRFLYETAESVTDFDGYTTAEGTVEFKFAPQVQDGDILRISEGDYSVGFRMLAPEAEEDSVEGTPVVTEVLEEITVWPTETPTEEISSVTLSSAPITFLKGEILNEEEIPATMEVLTAEAGILSAETGVQSLDTEAENSEVPEVIWTDVEQAVSEEADAELMESIKADSAVTSVGYGNVLPGVSLQYVLSGSSVKEYILVSQKQESYSYDFLLNLEKLQPEMQADGSILLKDEKTGEAVYQIPAAYMTDAAGTYSDAVVMTLSETENGWKLRITADAEWINAKERVFPVQIDPTIVHQPDSDTYINGYYVNQNSPTKTYLNRKLINVGYDINEKQRMSFVQLRNLPSLPQNSVVCAAYCHFLVASYVHDGFNRITVRAKKITGNNSWGTSFTWNNQPQYEDITLDYQDIGNSSIADFVGWNITDIIKEHYQAGNTSAVVSGFVLQAEESKDMDSSDYGHVSLCLDYENIYPILQIVYRDTKGIEGYYTYQTHSLGHGGTAYIGDYNSQLTLVKPVASYESTIMSYGLNLVYNSSFGTKNFSNDGKNLHTENFTGARTGPGWKLSAQETVVEIMLEDAEGNDVSWLVYNDSDGTEHYFQQKKDDEDVYEDEDGLNLTITKGDSNYTFVMKDKKDNKKSFKEGYLQKIEDANGNAVHIVYNDGTASSNPIDGDDSNQITSIWIQPKGQSNAEKIMQITYDTSGYVSVIEETYGTKYRIGYSQLSSGYSYPTKFYTYDEAKKQYVETARYGYATSQNLLSYIVDAGTENGIFYQYTQSPTGYRIYYWRAYAINADKNADKHTGNETAIIADEIRKTVYHDYGTDRTYGTVDDLETTYLFNSSGHTINVYTRDASGKLVGVSAAAYEEKNGTSKKNNRISNSIAGGQAGVNLLLNGGFEKYTDTTATGWSKSGDGKAACKTTAPRSGNAHYNLYNESETGSVMIYRSLTLTKGKTYTLSAYVNTLGMEAVASDGGASLKILNSSDVQKAQGTVLSHWTEDGIEKGWQRITVTYTPTVTGSYKLCLQWKHARGTLRADDVQLEMEDTPSSYNYLYNASFENGTDGWNFTGTGQESVVTGNAFHGEKAFQAVGVPGTQVYAQLVIPIRKSSDTTFLLSGWSKGDSVTDLEKTADDAAKRFWGMQLTLEYSDGNRETHSLPFNEFIRQWQYASMAIVPKESGKTVSRGILRLCYYCNANTAWFDNISLTEEPAQTYKYDDKGNLISVKSTGNGTESYGYDSTTQNLLSVGTEGSGTYTYRYENSVNKHLPTKVINDTLTMGITYDSYGQSTMTTLVGSTDTSVKMQSSAAYANGLLTSQTDCTGATTTYGYSTDRENTYIIHPGGRTISNFMDPVWKRADRTYQSNVASVNYGYTEGMLSTITRGGYLQSGATTKYNQIYGFTYDVFGNRESVIIQGETRKKSDNSLLSSSSAKTLVSYDYQPYNGNLESITYAPDLTTPLAMVSYTYDNLDRVKTINYSGTNTTYGYNYSSDGSLSGITKNGTLAYTYEYDSLGRLISSQRISNNRPVLYTLHEYDTSDRLLNQLWQVDGVGFYENYSYNSKDGTLKTMTVNGAVLNFQYNSLKQLAKRTSPKLDVEYTYCPNGTFSSNRIYEIRYRKHGENTYLLPRLTYAYDNAGNISSVTPLNKTAVVYTYDSQNQLLTETKGSVKGEYAYDTYGNIRSKKWTDASGTKTYTFTYGTGSGDEGWLDQLKEVSYKNAAGSTTTKTLNYDAIGNPTSYYNGDAEWTFTWQNGRQLATAKKSGSSTITNTYDVDGIRESKTVGGVKHTYTTLSGKIIRESYGTTTVDYLYDNKGNPYKMILNLNGTPYVGYFSVNQQGDVIAILDSNGAVAVTYEYDAWGKEVGHTVTGNAGSTGSVLYDYNRLKYRGYYYDSDLGLYYLNSRFYDPAIGRFINADTIELVLASQSTLSDKNLYAYCDNNPVMRRDESGAAWETVFDVISLGASITDVVANPANAWAWIGLAGDIADVAIPFIGGIGETIKCCGAVNKADNIIDVAKKSGKETELFLPDKFYNKNLPSQVTPGTKYLPKYDEAGNIKQIKMYDDYGRESGWVDYTNHGYGNVNSPHYHTTPHWHEKIYNAQYPDGIKIHHRTDINTPLGAK